MRPGEIATVEDLVEALDVARRRAARGTGRARVALTELARRSGIPRSTVHVYVTGRRLPTPDALDAVLLALDVAPAELGAWATALERVVAGDDPTPRPATPAPVPRQAPLFPRDVVGRLEELAALDDRLATAADDPVPLVVVLTGPGGVGKSTLVSWWAAAHDDQFPDGTLWLDLHGFGLQPALDAGGALGRMLVALGHPAADLPADAEARADLFRSMTHGRRMLLVLDNAAGSAQVRLLLPGAVACTVVVTSRSELRTLVTETGATRLRIGALDDRAGWELLGRHAGDLPDALARRVVTHCAGLPLALRIARERLSGRGLDDVTRFVDQLDDRSARLQALGWSDGTVETGIRPVLHASYVALTGAAAAAFRALPLCLGRGVDLVDVATCLDLPAADTRRRLEELVDANLLTETGLDRYAVPDLVAVYADEVAREDAADRDARDRRLTAALLDGARAACAAIAPGWDSAAPLVAVDVPATASAADATDWLVAHADLLVAVAGRCRERGDLETAWLVLGTTARALLYRADVTVLVQPLAALAEAVDRDGPVALAPRVWRASGGVATCADPARAEPSYRHGLAAAQAAGDELEQILARRNLAYLDLLAGAPRPAVAHLEEVAEAFGRRGEPVPFHALLLLAAGHGMRGSTDRAVGFVHQAMARAEDDGLVDTVVMCHLDLAWLAQEAGRPPEVVLEHTARARTRLGPLDSHHELHEPTPYEVRALLDLGRHDDAADLLSRTRRRTRSHDRDGLAVDVERGVILVRTGHAAAAVEHLASVAAAARADGMWWEHTSALLELARATLATGDVTGAGRLVRDGAALCADRGYARRAERFDELARECALHPV